MDETRIDRLEARFDELAAEMRNRFSNDRYAAVQRQDQLGQPATKAEFRALETRGDQCATKVELGELRTEMYRMSAEPKSWMLATMVTRVTMVTIIATFLAALFGQHDWNQCIPPKPRRPIA